MNIIKKPVTNLGMDVASNLATHCGVYLRGDVRSHSEPAKHRLQHVQVCEAMV
jgi:hypothetical protein